MDIPLFHLDWLNNRMLIAIIAILHVLINHSLAVGFMPLVTWLEQKGVTRSKANEITDFHWDKLVYRIMMVAFIITTTIGALTGVGIWLSASLISPNSIGSLIRVFYFAWFIEWIVFVTEVVLILIYFLTWKNANTSLQAKLKHIRFGWFLSIFSWITMSIIVAILGFMMDPGNWNTNQNLITGVFNPLYIPQLAYRTPLAMVMAGTVGLFLVSLFTQKGEQLRLSAFKAIGKWTLLWLPFAVAGAVYYYKFIPTSNFANMSVAIGTQSFQDWYAILWKVILGGAVIILLTALVSFYKPQKLNAAYLGFTVLVAFGFLGIFERVREFIRKPYIIGNYMYSNLLREEDYPLYKKDGILKWATYSNNANITAENKISAGRDIFMLTCSRCHTTQGINAITYVFDRMYGGKGEPFNADAMKNYINGMHNARGYMPPFPGNKKELDALVAYIKELQMTGEVIEGAQETGIMVNPAHTVSAYQVKLEEKIKEQTKQNQQSLGNR